MRVLKRWSSMHKATATISIGDLDKDDFLGNLTIEQRLQKGDRNFAVANEAVTFLMQLDDRGIPSERMKAAHPLPMSTYDGDFVKYLKGKKLVSGQVNLSIQQWFEWCRDHSKACKVDDKDWLKHPSYHILYAFFFPEKDRSITQRRQEALQLNRTLASSNKRLERDMGEAGPTRQQSRNKEYRHNPMSRSSSQQSQTDRSQPRKSPELERSLSLSEPAKGLNITVEGLAIEALASAASASSGAQPSLDGDADMVDTNEPEPEKAVHHLHDDKLDELWPDKTRIVHQCKPSRHDCTVFQLKGASFDPFAYIHWDGDAKRYVQGNPISKERWREEAHWALEDISSFWRVEYLALASLRPFWDPATPDGAVKQSPDSDDIQTRMAGARRDLHHVLLYLAFAVKFE